MWLKQICWLNYTLIWSWNQPVLDALISCQIWALRGFKLSPDILPFSRYETLESGQKMTPSKHCVDTLDCNLNKNTPWCFDFIITNMCILLETRNGWQFNSLIISTKKSMSPKCINNVMIDAVPLCTSHFRHRIRYFEHCLVPLQSS